jgi:hypothetical protein
LGDAKHPADILELDDEMTVRVIDISAEDAGEFPGDPSERPSPGDDPTQSISSSAQWKPL